MEYVTDWSGLPPELLEQIAKCLPLMEDLTAFRGVCTTWRGAVTRSSKHKFKVPLLMLAEKHHRSYNRCFLDPYKMKFVYERDACKCKIHCLPKRKKKNKHRREFYSLSKRKVCARLPFPDAKGKKCIDVGFGWILAVSALGGNAKVALGDISDGKVSLVKPFYSSQRIKLPNMKEFPNYEDDHHPDFDFFQRAVLIADPSETSDFKLVLLTDRYLVFWRNGDKNWTRINPDKPIRSFVNMVYYKGCIYALCSNGKIWMWDPNGNDLTKAEVVLQLDSASQLVCNKMVYPVESTDGKLLVIVRNNHTTTDDYVSQGVNYFRVMRVDIEARIIEDLQSVGKDAIFLGNNTTVAVAACDYPGVLQPNSIYFTDDCIYAYFLSPHCRKGGGKDMGIYNLEDGSIQRFGIRSFSPISPPMWIFPSF